jgi:hypothetical protein
MSDMKAKVGDTLDLQALADQHRWHKGLTVVLQGSMRAVLAPGKADLLAGWRADIREPGQRKPTVVIVDETLPGLLRQLAALCEDGPLVIGQARESQELEPLEPNGQMSQS